ncbi:MAG: hypothetical protein KKA61_00665 [Nanoarchaeota archaeon]|nr:hypothetical protein [Nanoarchaeota archaeon]
MAKKKKRTKKKSVKKRLIAPLYKKPKSSEAKFLIAVLAILIIIFFISSFYSRYKVKSEAEIIINKLIVGDEVNEQALNSFMSTDYNELKKELGITKNFLVYFEDEDETIIPVNGRYCFGYEEAALNSCR